MKKNIIGLIGLIVMLGVIGGCKRKESFQGATVKKKTATLTAIDWPGTGDRVDSELGTLKDLQLTQ